MYPNKRKSAPEAISGALERVLNER